MLLRRVQRGLEQLYRVDTQVDVTQFLIDSDARGLLEPARMPGEQLFVAQEDGALDIGLFVDERALANLAQHDPARGLDERNLGDFLLTVEGVSHFVYLVWRARAHCQVSALELELKRREAVLSEREAVLADREGLQLRQLRTSLSLRNSMDGLSAHLAKVEAQSVGEHRVRRSLHMA